MAAELRETGIAAIGAIPVTWKLERLNNVAELFGRIGWQGLTSDEYTDEGAYLVTGTDFRDGYIDWSSCVHVSEERWEEAWQIKLQEGDLLISKDGTIGKLAIVSDLPGHASLNSGLMRIVPRSNGYVTKYLYYVLQTDVFYDWYREIDAGASTIKHLFQGDFIHFVYPSPPIEEQEAIAEELDKRTAVLDHAISLVTRQLETLDAYRKSLIQEAVTKGLNPDVELKPSGIDWIGIIPAGWKTTKLKGLVRHFESGTSVRAAQYPAIDGEPGVLSLSAVFQGRFNADANKAVGDDEAPRLSCPVRYGTLLVSRCNTSEWVGTAALVDKECDNLYLPDKIWQIDCETSLHNRYVRYALSSPYARAYCWMMSVGASESMQNIASFDLLNMPFAIPETIEEMQAVVEYLDDKISKVDALIAGKRKQLETLRAQRQSLIYEYVTGKRRVL